MNRIKWEKMPKPLKLLLLPFLPLLFMLGWIMTIVGERKENARRVERATLCSDDKRSRGVLPSPSAQCRSYQRMVA